MTLLSITSRGSCGRHQCPKERPLRKFTNSLSIEERKQREREFKMKLDQAKRFGVPVSAIEPFWEKDRLANLTLLQDRLKKGSLKTFNAAEIKEVDAIRTIMEEYECEEWRAKQIYAKKESRLRAEQGAVGSSAPARGGAGRREPEVVVIRRLVRPDKKPVGR